MVPDEYTDDEWQRIRAEFSRLKDVAYLDHAGASLYSERQLNDATELLRGALLGNPHSDPKSGDLVDQVRFRVLNHFDADPAEYSVVFTAGATASLKLVGDAFAFDGGRFAYVSDSHTSVLGMRAIVDTVDVCPVSRADFAHFVDGCERTAMPEESQIADGKRSLFVYASQCNFNAYKFGTEVVPVLQRSGPPLPHLPALDEEWFVLVDAASHAASGQLNLDAHRPDFVCVSFYKLFGYPTGLGALLVSRRGERALSRRRFYGGGTVRIAMARRDWHVPHRRLHDRLEDGTLSFLSVVQLLAGFETLERLVPADEPTGRSTMQRIEGHCFAMARYLYRQLDELRYANGCRVVRFYMDTRFEDASRQGGIVNFNVQRPDGQLVGFREIGEIAQVYDVRLRTGCFCNPGTCQRQLALSDEQVQAHYQAGHVCGDSMDLIDGQPTGSVRVSVGYMTETQHVDRVVRMLRETYLNEQQSAIRSISSTGSIESADGRRDQSVRLSAICVFPVKSCAAHRLIVAGERWPLTERGLRYDREWMIVDRRTGAAVTQKHNARLCLIRPEIDLRRERMLLRHPDVLSVCSVTLAEPPTEGRDESSFGLLCSSKVCGDRIDGADCGDAVADWLAEALGSEDLRLIRQRDERKQRRGAGSQAISLANQAQFLLVNEASVEWLVDEVDAWSSPDDAVQRKRRRANTVDRFRANLVVRGTDAGPLDELRWTSVRVNGTRFRVQGPCTRCQMICIDQTSGEKTGEPLRTIGRLFGGKMRFGVYMEMAEAGEWIECGSEIAVEREIA